MPKPRGKALKYVLSGEMSLKIAFVYQNKLIVLRRDLTAEIDDLRRDAAAELKIEEFSTITLSYGDKPLLPEDRLDDMPDIVSEASLTGKLMFSIQIGELLSTLFSIGILSCCPGFSASDLACE